MGDCGGAGMESRSPSPKPGPDPFMIDDECWVAAEEAAQEILNWIHPVLNAEEKRRDVIEYLRKLVKDTVGGEVIAYGSVPLKTYLPDGDIDVTVLNGPSEPRRLLNVIEREEKNENSEFKIKGTKYISGAEVKLVKCFIQGIVVDISFNQLGGLRTLYFLEQVDRLIGQDHLFKRSILLVKTWCYFESRILGAHHGLFSTYALETLVLYIFNLFHHTCTGPLKVLYIFLDYFSKFEWDKYGITLNGPVHKQSLPAQIPAAMPENVASNLLISEEFIENCTDLFSFSCLPEQARRGFKIRNFDVIDPLLFDNNLGRSVHRGNFYRILSAFRYGARNLGRILSVDNDNIADEIKDFFSNTKVRHGHRNGKDIPIALPISSSEANLYMSSSFSSDDDSSPLKSPIDNGKAIVAEEEKPVSENHLSSIETCYMSDTDEFEEILSKVSSPSKTDLSFLEYKERDFLKLAKDCVSINPLADLTGDNLRHIRCLLYSQGVYGYTHNFDSYTPPASSNYGMQRHYPSSSNGYSVQRQPWEVVRQAMPLTHVSNLYTGPPPPTVSTPPLDMSMTRNYAIPSADNRANTARGTGMYFPNTAQQPQNGNKDKRYQNGRPKNKGRGGGSNRQNQRHNHLTNGPSNVSSPTSSHNGSIIFERPTSPAVVISRPPSRQSAVTITSPKLQFGSISQFPELLPSPSSPKPNPNPSPKANHNHTSNSSWFKPKTSNAGKQTRVVEQKAQQQEEPVLQLKNEEEFPPLSA